MEPLQDLEKIDQMDEEQLDTLPFGAIRLDRNGTILATTQRNRN